MHNNVAVIIPALDKNRYSPEGDLVRFGDLSLLEWKITQVKNFIEPDNIYVSSPSLKIEKVAKTSGVNFQKRNIDLPMAQAIIDGLKKIDKDIIVFTHVTSPFVSSLDFNNMLGKFLKLNKPYDSLVSVFKLQEYLIFKNKALNFDMQNANDRNRLEPVYRITNGCSIARKEIFLKFNNFFGTKPFLYEIDMLASMEIQDIGDLAVMSDMISLFFKKELQV